MTQPTQKFLEAEESATKVLQALEALRDEADRHLTSAQQLDEARTGLTELIGVVQEAAQGTFDTIQMLKSIGGPEILAQIDSLAQEIAQTTTAHAKQISQLRLLLFVTLALSGVAVLVGILVLLK